MKSPIRYLTENSTKSLCRRQDSDSFCFLDSPRLCLFCTSFSDSRGPRPVSHLTRLLEQGADLVIVQQMLGDIRPNERHIEDRRLKLVEH